MHLELIRANKRRSFLLLAGLALVILAVVAALDLYLGGGPIWLAAGVGLALGGGWLSYRSSDRIALAASRARPADPERYRSLHNIVEALAIGAGIPKPDVYVVDDPAPNAFATGRNPDHAAVAVTTGLLERMDRRELEAVLAHELAHIRNYDILVGTIAVTAVGGVVLLADLALRWLWWGGGRSRSSGRRAGGNPLVPLLALVVLILAPVVARLLRFAVSRRRESLADASAVEITRNPVPLISALEKLREDTTVVRSSTKATEHLWFEQPLDVRGDVQGHQSRLNRLFDTHPPLEERIAALRRLTLREP